MTDRIETAHSNREGIRAFQLRILAGMRNSGAMVEQALRELGADQAEMERCRTATENIFAPTGRFENVTSILGPPLASETVHHEQGEAADALTLTKLSYRLPVWPDLVFYFLGYPGVPVMHDFGFARPAPGGLMSPRELVPTLRFDAQTVNGAAGALERFGVLSCEVLLLGGSRSARNLTASLDGLCHVLPGARRVVIRGTGHTAPGNSRHPDRVAAVLRDFFG